jgi:amino acid adenylation domain-containing protein
MIEEVYPLSPLQAGMLFNQLYAPHSGVDIEQIVCTLPENLNIPVLEKAWQLIIQRHAILRTAFRWLDLDQPQQEVHSLDVVGQVVNLSSANEQVDNPSAELRAGLLHNFLQADRQRGFDLDRPPLMRVHVLRVTGTDSKMIWTFHHILLDGRSFPLILKELFELYESIDQSRLTQAVKHTVRTVELATPRPYKDYIDWLQQQQPDRSESFWRQTLQGFGAPTPLMIDQAATGLSGYDTRPDTLSADNTARLKAFAEQHAITLNTLVQGAWALLLHRYSGESDVVFGATRSCRRSALDGNGTDNMIGLFINTLPLRIHVSSEMSVLDYLKDVRQRWTAMRDHEHTPLVNVQTWSEIPKNTPLFDSLFVFENYLLQSAMQRLGGDWLKREVQLYEQTNYPLTLAAYGDTSLLLRIEYDRSRFQADAIDRMLGHLQVLLMGFLSHADQPIDTLPMLTEAEQHQLLIEWNATQRDYPRERSFQSLFEDQVERTPEAKAVIFKNEALTYRELNSRADELAAHLQTLGVGPDTIVGICIERCLEMMIGLLAILKAGGAYLPIDPAIPAERWQFMLEDASVKIMLTQQRWADRFIEHCSNVIKLDSDWQTQRSLSAANPIGRSTPDNLAYVIYTSGSTGKPKGTLITQRGLVNYLTWGIETYAVAQGNGAPVHSSIGFDLTITGLFMPLLTGRSVIMVSEDEEYEGLANVFRRERNLSLVKITPAHLELLAQQLPPAELKDRSNCLVIGGEALRGEALAVWQTHAPNTRLINEYGPTETVVGCCVYEVPPSETVSGSVLIGKPIANTQLYVCDALGRLRPIGVPGELVIGGAGVARGYLNRPELTAEKFVADRFGADPNARLYRTGDQVRYLADGNLEYLGRLDDQVKIRGYRIEPGEVETVLAAHPSLRAAAIAVQEDAAHDKRLVAYFVPDQIPAPTENELREYLRARLPEYMLPAAFVEMEALPLTVNGKIDRRALPAPDLARSTSDQDYAAPHNPIEQVLAEVWGQILGVERVSINANFFELGGHSLAATRLMAKLHQIFRVDLPLRDLFETRNIVELAERLIAHEAAPGQVLAAARVQEKISQMTPAEIEALLAKKKQPQKS